MSAAVDPRELCAACFADLGDSSVCRSCGFDEAEANGDRDVLPLRAVLAGQYVVGRALGRGGFGITYRGWDLNLRRKVAIKEYLPERLAFRKAGSSVVARSERDEETLRSGRERLLREAQTVARFRHPNIVRVHHAFEANGTAYVVMELYAGESLATCLGREGRLSVQETLGILLPLLDGLELVHDHGFLHRDIKPANILLTEDEPVLIDFGAARYAVGEQTELTAVLTPGYAPLEQYPESEQLGKQGPWTDVYGVAATLYRMLTGRRPPQAISRLLGERLRLEVSGVPPRFRAAVERGLSLTPEARPQSIRDFRILLNEENRTSTGSDNRNRILRWLAAGLAAAVLAAAAILLPDLVDLPLGNSEGTFSSRGLSQPARAPRRIVWKQLASNMPTPRSNPSCLAVDQRVITLGGHEASADTYDAETGMRTNEIYDTTNDTWAAGAPVPQGRGGASFALARVENYVYAIGGANPPGTGHYNDIHRYDIEENSWEQDVAKFGYDPVGVVRPSVIALDGLIYLFGGYGNVPGFNHFHNESFAFDVETLKLRRLATMTVNWTAGQGGDTGTFAIGEEIWLIGGDDEVADARRHPMLAYDPRTNSWRAAGPAMPYGTRALRVGELLLALNVDLSRAWFYSPSSQQWLGLASRTVSSGLLPNPGCIVTVGSRLLAFGGTAGRTGNPIGIVLEGIVE